MVHITLEELEKLAVQAPDDLLAKSFLQGALKLTNKEINTLVFLYGLCYLAERDIGEMLPTILNKLSNDHPQEVMDRVKIILNDFLNKKINETQELNDVLQGLDQDKANLILTSVKGRYNKKPLIDIEKLSTFGEKIFVYEQLFFENNVIKIFRKIKKIRNDISHLRIADLTYNSELLILRKTKEKILKDYFEAVFNPDHSRSNFQENIEFLPEEDSRVIALLDKLY
jgi:hypothetical protein